MQICIFGAGAIGSYLAVHLSSAGHDVCVVARGDHLNAIRKNGLRLYSDGAEKHVRLEVSDQASDFGKQDVVFCALKAHQAYQHAAEFLPLLDAQTAVVTAMNGIPWWYFYKEGSHLDGTHLASVDPGGRQWNTIGPHRAIGCVVEPACEITEPGVVVHNRFNRFQLGEPDGTVSTRVLSLSAAMEDAGFEAPIRKAIRWNVWLKLWGNVCFNPISALTGATLDRIVADPTLRKICERAMREAMDVSTALGVEIGDTMIARRLAAAGAATGHKMSMLQDLERGRTMEIDALIASVQEIAGMLRIETPIIDTLLGLARLRSMQAGLYSAVSSSISAQ